MTRNFETLESKIAREIPNAAALMAADEAAGLPAGLLDFYERHKPLASVEPKPGSLEQATAAVAELRSTIERRALEIADARREPQIEGLRARAERAEQQLSEARGQIRDLESAERASALGQRILELTNERDQALTAKAMTERNMSLLEGLAGIRGIDPATAVPSASEDDANHGSPVARYKRAVANGNEKERKEIFAAHKDEIWAELQPTSTLAFRS